MPQVALLLRWISSALLFLFSVYFSQGINASEQTVEFETDHFLEPAPPYHLQDNNGHDHNSWELRDKVAIVNFWATWCTPCRKELPSLNRAWKVLKLEGVTMLAINVGEEVEAVNAFLKDYPIHFPVLLDERGNISQRWRVSGLPTTFVVNSNGDIVARATGPRTWDNKDLLNDIRRLQLGGGQRQPSR